MQIDLTVSDIVSLTLRSYLANRARYVISLAIAIAYGLYLIADLGVPADRRAWMIYISGGVLFAIAFFVLFLIAGTLNAALMARQSASVIGAHEIEISPEGLRDSTELTDSFTRWPAIYRISRRGDYLAFWISPYLAHIVPARAFVDAEAFSAFERLANAFHAGENVTIAPRAPRPAPIKADPSLWKRPA